jgi:acetate kinase
MPKETISPRWQGQLRWPGHGNDASLEVKNDQGQSHRGSIKIRSIKGILSRILRCIYREKTAVLSSLSEIDIIGHRIVHGGPHKKSTPLTNEVKEVIRRYAELAPQHNTVELQIVDGCQQLMPDITQVGVFDTAFHRTLSKAASIYPGPYQWFEDGIRRYGFHGISFQYCVERCQQLLDKDISPLKIIICHLGAGASLCAVKEKKSYDTTMGFTTLDGLMMATRPGSLDPGIFLYLLKHKKKSLKELSDDLYRNSGLLGISGYSADMSDILEAHLRDHQRAKLAFDIYLHRLTGSIGSMMASLQGLDILVFSGGIGENSPLLRKEVCRRLAFTGLRLDQEKNSAASDQDSELSHRDSSGNVLLIHTCEELEIAKECLRVIKP